MWGCCRTRGRRRSLVRILNGYTNLFETAASHLCPENWQQTAFADGVKVFKPSGVITPSWILGV